MCPGRLQLYVDTQMTSPYALSAFVALREKNLPFELHQLDLEQGQQHEAAYAGLSLTQRVPTLVHDDFALSESSAITEYLDQVFPHNPLYPAAPRDRAKARQVQAWLRSDLLPIRQERSTQVVFYGIKAGPLSTSAQACAQRLIKAALALLGEHQAQLFERWSIADVDLATMLNRLILNGDPVPETLVTYAHRQWMHPAIEQWVNSPRPRPGA